jgi:hypothetical protein
MGAVKRLDAGFAATELADRLGSSCHSADDLCAVALVIPWCFDWALWPPSLALSEPLLAMCPRIWGNGNLDAWHADYEAGMKDGVLCERT